MKMATAKDWLHSASWSAWGFINKKGDRR